MTEAVGVHDPLVASVEGRELVHVGPVELEVEDVPVLVQPLGFRRLGDRDEAELDVPPEHDLRRRPGVTTRQLDDRGVREEVTARADRRPALGHDPVLFVEPPLLGPARHRIQVDLVHVRRDARFLEQPSRGARS